MIPGGDGRLLLIIQFYPRFLPRGGAEKENDCCWVKWHVVPHQIFMEICNGPLAMKLSRLTAITTDK